MQGELQAFKVGRVVRNRTFIYKGLTVTIFFSHSTLKSCNSPCMQYYFKRFMFCIPRKLYFHFWSKSQVETEISFFSFPWIISFVLHISVITSPTNWYLHRWVSRNISEVINENSTSAFNYLYDFSSWPPVQQKSRPLVGLNRILFCFNNSSQITKNQQG